MVGTEKPLNKIWDLHIVCWITKVKTSHLEYVINTCFSKDTMAAPTRCNMTLSVLIFLVLLCERKCFCKLRQNSSNLKQ